MPYSDRNFNTTQEVTWTNFAWWEPWQAWYKTYDSSLTVPRLYDRVSQSTQRPKPSGWKPPSAYERTIERWSLMPGYRQSWNSSGTPTSYSVGRIWTGVSGTSPPDVPVSVRNAMHFAVLDRIKNQKMDLGVSLAEFPKTAKMVGSAAKSIARSIMLARRGRFNDASRELGLDSSIFSDVSKRWLSLQYGWTPLMMDVNAACSTLSSGLGDWRFGATAKRPYPFGDGVPNAAGHIVTRTGTRMLKLRLDFEVDNSKAMSFAQLGLTNPASIAWELVPFSFVLDWFVPVGDWLGALDLGMFCTFKGGTFTDFYNITDTHVGERSLTGGSLTVGSYGHKLNRVRVKRDVISSYLPSIIAKPDFSLSLKQMASGLSLLQEVVVRGKR